MTSGTWQVLRVIPTPWGLQQSAHSAESQQAVGLCEHPGDRKPLASCQGQGCHWTLHTEKQTFP